MRTAFPKVQESFDKWYIVGATSGIGESTLKQWCRHTIKPRVYVVGRSQDAADRIFSELKTIQPETEANFIRKDLTLIKNVDEVCEEIKAKESKLNLLFMTPGTLSLKGRDGEGLIFNLCTILANIACRDHRRSR